MRKFTFALLAAIIAVAGLAISVGPADAAHAVKNTRKCMTLTEWRKINDDGSQSRARVAQIVGNRGTQFGHVTHYSDGTISVTIEYRKCGRSSYDTVWLSYTTDVTYGAYVWDETAIWHDGYMTGGYDEWNRWSEYAGTYVEGYYEGDWVWDEDAEGGATKTAKVSYKGSY